MVIQKLFSYVFNMRDWPPTLAREPDKKGGPCPGVLKFGFGTGCAAAKFESRPIITNTNLSRKSDPFIYQSDQFCSKFEQNWSHFFLTNWFVMIFSNFAAAHPVPKPNLSTPGQGPPFLSGSSIWRSVPHVKNNENSFCITILVLCILFRNTVSRWDWSNMVTSVGVA